MASSSRFSPLKRRADFERLRAYGFRSSTSSLVANFSLNELGVVRVGWTLPRKVGSAVVRNRLRRWGRDYFRKWARKHDLEFDINIVLKPRPDGMYKSLSHEDFDALLARITIQVERKLRGSRA